MPSEPFRFLHASHLQLDAPLTGTGPLDSEDRRVAEDATLTALDHVVDACLEQDVEFLLLTGPVFGCGQPTLRARRALLSAFENLCEFEIQVFWDVSREELTEVFAESDELPGNVTPIDPEDREPIAVIRQGRVIASISSGRSAEPVTLAEGDRDDRGAFRVGLFGQPNEPAAPDPAADYDYVAMGSRRLRTTHHSRSAVVHHPGAVQGINERDTGSHGATLIHVGVDRETELAFVPAAPVRWERMLVSVEPGTTAEQLGELMQTSLLELEPACTERLWIVNWEFVGSGELFDELQTDEATEELRERVRQGLAVGSRIHRYDRFRFRRRLAQHPDELTQQVCEWIASEDTSLIADVLNDLHALAGPGGLQQAMTESLTLLDRARTQDAARRLSQELMLPSVPGGIQRKRESR